MLAARERRWKVRVRERRADTGGAEPAVGHRDRRQVAAAKPDRGIGLEQAGGGIEEIGRLVSEHARGARRRDAQQRRERDRTEHRPAAAEKRRAAQRPVRRKSPARTLLRLTAGGNLRRASRRQRLDRRTRRARAAAPPQDRERDRERDGAEGEPDRP